MIPAHVLLARSLIGKPFVHQGRGVGLDCAGMLKYIGDAQGLNLEDVRAYRAQPSHDELRKVVRRNLGQPRWVRSPSSRVPVAQIGDVVMISFRKSLTHLALVADYVHGGLSLIHAFEAGADGRVVEHRLDSKWSNKILEVYPWPELH